MAASPTPRPTRASAGDNPALAPLRASPPLLPLAVAFSGGADSTVLLFAAAQLWPGQVHAIHVHHGLQAAADDFARHCEAVCKTLDVPLHVVRVDARNEPGESPEDAARKARYSALAASAASLGMHSVQLAQHADDQVETLLLALSRGAGLPGLAAMPAGFKRHGMRFERPLLAISGADLRAWLAAQGVAFVEDPTNADTAITRNRIRRDVLPALQKAFPRFRETFARSARHAAQAQELLTVLAVQDLASVGNPPALRELRKLPRARQSNLLRHWLRAAHQVTPSAAQVEELLDQIEACATRGHAIRIKVAAGRVELHQGMLKYSGQA
ncbi:MAG TPA: tRNA lysidine(34) synthetase TilS [Ramlibacter sp.]|nr:tRNA lysidine(34) synthetase TilS [Ramlibacter sp.]